MRPYLYSLSAAVALLAAGPVAAEVKLPNVFSDHMVLQRDLAVPIWGTAAAGEKVTVKFRGQEKATTADQDGKWLVKLDPLQAGGPHELTVTSGNSVTIGDVLVGEVWIGSGQSNMAGGVAGYAKGGDEVLAKLAAASYPRLRLHKGGAGSKWLEATEANNNGFSALMFAFGARLQQDLDVPVGLMVGAVGGTPSGRWLSNEMLTADTACQEVLKKFAANYDMAAEQKKYELALANWEKAAEAAKKDGKTPPPRPNPPQKPGQGLVGDLFNAHIKPLIPYGIRGVLWDQGESGTQIFGLDQYTLMGALIRGWRKDWGQGDFPFLYIQKVSGEGCAWDPKDPVTSKANAFTALPATVPSTADGLYRETHIKIMTYPATAMVTSTDLGPGIHPVNKSGYGSRAARVALGMVYGRKVEYYGPVYDKHTTEGSKVRVRFMHTGQGLAFKNGDKLQGFAVAGPDKVFHWADAVIDGDSVIVSCDQVPQPAAVRYGWGSKIPWANLFNKDGLPAVSFRTDNW